MFDYYSKFIHKFGDSINKFFADQFVELKCIAIGKDEHPTNVHSMPISKNSNILPMMDSNILNQ